MAQATVKMVDGLPEDWAVVRLARILREFLPELRERYSIGSLQVFGSYVRNEQQPVSDLDILVEFARTPSLFEIMRLEDANAQPRHAKCVL